MKEISDCTVLVEDTGLFLPMALRMAEKAKRVIYHNPDCRSFPSVKQGCIGDGFENVERVHDFWPYLKEIDLAAFPDCAQAGLQRHLEQEGIAVWGSRGGIELEMKRHKFMDVLKEVRLEVPPFQSFIGLGNLSEYLETAEDCYIKLSRYRGDMETKHWRNWTMDAGWLMEKQLCMGPISRHLEFLVFDKIDTPLEIGADLYCVDGQYPSIMLNGVEGKDKCYMASVTNFDKMPKEIQHILRAIGPVQASYMYRNQMSLEVRVKDDKFYWNDATQRGGMPSTASQHKLWKNFPEIVLAGANGELIDPEPAAKFSIECMITTKPNASSWHIVELPDSLKPWARFSNCAFIDGCYCFPPDEVHNGEFCADLGWLVAIGDTPTEVLQLAKDLADLLPDGLNADVEALADVIKEIEVMEEENIPFTKQKLPEPAEVL